MPRLITASLQSWTLNLQLQILTIVKLTYSISTSTLFYTIHPHFLLLRICLLYTIHYLLSLSLSLMYVKLSFHLMFKNLLEWIKSLPEYYRTVPMFYVSHFTTCLLNHCTVPSCWKVHKVIPISKLLMLIVWAIITQFHYYLLFLKFLKDLCLLKQLSISTNPSVHPAQFGFTKNCSALQQMLIFNDYIINSPLQTDVIYLDINKAFDTVSHMIVFCWLSCGWLALLVTYGLGLRTTCWTVFKVFLSTTVTLICCLLFQECHRAVSLAPCYS